MESRDGRLRRVPHLAMVEKVSSVTRNQALSAWLWRFRERLRTDLAELASTAAPLPPAA